MMEIHFRRLLIQVGVRERKMNNKNVNYKNRQKKKRTKNKQPVK